MKKMLGAVVVVSFYDDRDISSNPTLATGILLNGHCSILPSKRSILSCLLFALKLSRILALLSSSVGILDRVQ